MEIKDNVLLNTRKRGWIKIKLIRNIAAGMMEKEIGITLFDDNRKILDSIAMLVESYPGFRLRGAYHNALNIVEDVGRTQPDIVLLDIDMPGVNGIDGLKRLKKEYPDIPVLMLTSFDDEQKIYDSLRYGARGYLLKSTPPDRILQAIRDAVNGGVPMTDRVAVKVLDYFRQPSRGTSRYQLTGREVEVLRLLVNGAGYQEVADTLSIGYETVRTHVKHIYAKLEVANLSEAVVKAVREQLID